MRNDKYSTEDLTPAKLIAMMDSADKGDVDWDDVNRILARALAKQIALRIAVNVAAVVAIKGIEALIKRRQK